MASLKADFYELLERIRRGRELGHASFEPIYYLIFAPARILEVKRQMPGWIAHLKNDGWQVRQFSIAEHIVEILHNAPLRKIWLTADGRDPVNWSKTNAALANALTLGSLQARLAQQLAALEGQAQAMLLLTDLEALHPYLRPGVLEGQIQGQCIAPTVFFYPGERTGKTRLKFLGFYPEDGNYRSVHVGG